MKKIVLITLILLMAANNAVAVTVQSDPMTDLAGLVVDSNLKVSEWQVTLKETVSYIDAEEILDRFREKNSYLVSGEEDANTIKYSVRHVQKKHGISESYNVIIPKDRTFDAQFIAVIKGDVWNKSVRKKYVSRINRIEDNLFSGNSTKFACVQTSFNDKMNSVYVFSKIRQTLNLKHVKKQEDTVENSMVKKIIYGYTPLWNQKIDLGDRPLNFQMAVNKGENGDTELTIGTPILINEY
ncbi:YwmB family TATA-box binding protein [Virgibacillus ihumii]|uniref:YwmB family TATA-box binding protein n=1 Tax=Virgibacillus ihumii TaxID=2686091 RepID=UPI00157CB208|nr:YwmB family TATA-box binding protein [Virgibacillus ihumii]